jgi:hypothetical protein
VKWLVFVHEMQYQSQLTATRTSQFWQQRWPWLPGLKAETG